MKPTNKLTEINTWRGDHRGIHYKIHRWEMGNVGTCWNYYIFLPETKVPSFDEIWIEPTLFQIMPISPKRVDHDYYGNALVCSIYLHGGITYYDTHGSIKGHRVVEIGCDYQHGNDMGKTYTVSDVQHDAIASIDDCIDKLNISVPNEQTTATPSAALQGEQS
jgi:hypothetical protein